MIPFIHYYFKMSSDKQTLETEDKVVKSLMRHLFKKQLTFSNIFSYKQVIQGKGLKFMFTTSRFISKTNIFQSFPGDRLCFHPDLLLCVLVDLSLLFKFHFLRKKLFSQTKPDLKAYHLLNNESESVGFTFLLIRLCSILAAH